MIYNSIELDPDQHVNTISIGQEIERNGMVWEVKEIKKSPVMGKDNEAWINYGCEHGGMSECIGPVLVWHSNQPPVELDLI